MIISALLIIYTTLAFAIHGGELLNGTPRQIRNLICALPFGLVAYLIASRYLPELDSGSISFVFLALAFWGADMGFDNHPLWLKGLITFPPLGAILLPIAYWIGYKTRYTNVLAEYLSGALYGVALAAIVAVW